MRSTPMLGHSSYVALVVACAAVVREAVRKADHLHLSPAEQQAAVLKGVGLMIGHGAFLSNDRIYFPREN